MSMNGDKTLDLSYFPLKFILHATPGHLKKSHLVAEWQSLNYQSFSEIKVLLKYSILSKFEHEWRSIIKAFCFPYKFIARVTLGHLPQMAFRGKIKPFLTTNLLKLFSTHIAPNIVNLWEWMVVKHWIYLVSHTYSYSVAWMEFKHWIYPDSEIFSYSTWRQDNNCISRWESIGNIIKHCFLLSSYLIP